MLSIGGYSGTAGNAFGSRPNDFHWLDGMMFSTRDRDNDKWANGKCALSKNGGWWYNWCANGYLNSLYDNVLDPKTITWSPLRKKLGGVIYSEMKMKYN